MYINLGYWHDDKKQLKRTFGTVRHLLIDMLDTSSKQYYHTLSSVEGHYLIDEIESGLRFGFYAY